MSIKGGYILQPRCVDEGSIAHNPPIDRELWAYLLRNVSHTGNGNLKRGQGFFKISDIREALHWTVGYRKEMYSRQQISKSLFRLHEGDNESDNEGDNEGDKKMNTKATMIEITKATRGIIVTICNYDYYQDPKNYEGDNESDNEGDKKMNTKATMKATTVRAAKNKNVKNITSSPSPSARARKDDPEQCPNATLSQMPKSCAKKVEEIQPIDGTYEYIPIKQVAIFLKSEIGWLEAFCMNQHLDPQFVSSKIDEYAGDLENGGETAKDKRDCKRHFRNWLRKNREINESRKATYTGRRATPDITNDEIDLRCAERVARRLAQAEACKVGT